MADANRSIHDQDAPALVADRVNIALQASWELEQLLKIARKSAINNHDELDFIVRGLMARAVELNATIMSALDHRGAAVDNLRGIVFGVGVRA